MGLLRVVGRTAVVAGTATAVSNRVSRRQAGRWEDQQQADADEAQEAQAAAAPPPPAAPAEPDYMAELNQLAQLKEQGVLSEEEFQAKKKQLLGI